MKLDSCLKLNTNKCDSILYSNFIFTSENVFKAKFVQFDDENLKSVNDFIFNLVKAYFNNISLNGCKRIEIKLVSYNTKFISLLMKLVYNDWTQYKSLNFDTMTMLPVSQKSLLKRLKVKKRIIVKTVRKVDKNYKIIGDTYFIFNNHLKFYCYKKYDEELAVFKIKISEN